MKTFNRIALASVICLALAAPAMAAGPLDGEVAAVWWANDFDSNSEAGASSTDGGAAGLRAQLWFKNKYGVKATQYGSDPADSDGADYTSVDVMWRPLSPTENNFVAVGLGWQQMDVAGLEDATSGMRVSFEGRVGLVGMVYAYGNAAYLPSLEDAASADAAFGDYQDLESYEYEFGVAWNATPFVNVHAGYRANTLDFNQHSIVTAGAGGEAIGVGSGGGNTSLVSAPGGSSCEGCEANMTIAESTGSFETAGFFAGVGIKF